MRKHMIFLILWGISLSPAFSQDYGSTDIVSVVKNQENLEKLGQMHLDLLMEREGRIYIVADMADLTQLNENNIPFTLESHAFLADSGKQMMGLGGINGAFHSYREVEMELFALEDAYPNLVRIHDIGDSLEGRNIYALKISDNVLAEENEAEVIFLGCHHAREWISVEVPLLLAKHLAENFAADAVIRSLLENSEIWIVPLVNPDGLEYSIHFYRYWRKNRRDLGQGVFGVDLNRNYGFFWGWDDIGSSGNPASEVYRGPTSFSEPETQAVRELIASHDFQALISYHNYSQIILYPWGYTKVPAPGSEFLESLAHDMAQSMRSVNGREYDYGQAGDALYVTNGDTTDWAFGAMGIPSFTVELPPPNQQQGGFFNPESEIQPIFEENLAAALHLIEWSVKNSQGSRNPEQTAETRYIFPKRKIRD